MTSSPNIADVTRADFATQVIERSQRTPVLVDFWAPWCGPCRMLTPTLTKLADSYSGKFFLAKINTDEEQELAVEYAIRGIPAVKLFREGQVVGEFVGVQPESAVRALLDRFIPREADAVIEQAQTLARSGKNDEAFALLREAVRNDPQHDKAKIVLARLLSASADGTDLKARSDEARKLLNSLSIRTGSDPEVESLRARIHLLDAVATDARSIEELKRAIESNPQDLDARYQYATRLALNSKYEDAMEQFLEIVRRDRTYRDDGGRKGLLNVFNIVGNRDPRVSQYRTVLARALN